LKWVPGIVCRPRVFLPPRRRIRTCCTFIRQAAPFRFDPAVKALIRACFQQRRKQIGALVRGRLSAGALAEWLAALAGAGLGPQSRPEQIPVALWRRLRV